MDLQADYSTAKVRGRPPAGREEGSCRVGVQDVTLPRCVFQGILGAGYQALRLARTLLGGQELMVRGLHWSV